MPDYSSFSVRFTPDLKSLAQAYCAQVGISLNALVVVAVMEYIRNHPVSAQQDTSTASDANLIPRPDPTAPPSSIPQSPSASRSRRKKRRR